MDGWIEYSVHEVEKDCLLLVAVKGIVLSIFVDKDLRDLAEGFLFFVVELVLVKRVKSSQVNSLPLVLVLHCLEVREDLVQ